MVSLCALPLNAHQFMQTAAVSYVGVLRRKVLGRRASTKAYARAARALERESKFCALFQERPPAVGVVIVRGPKRPELHVHGSGDCLLGLLLQLEVCVDSVASAVAAAEAGATRLELCAGLALGGVTPTIGTFVAVRQRCPALPVMVLVRPRAGDFCFSPEEVEAMETDIRLFRQHGASGFVLGALTSRCWTRCRHDFPQGVRRGPGSRSSPGAGGGAGLPTPADQWPGSQCGAGHGADWPAREAGCRQDTADARRGSERVECGAAVASHASARRSRLCQQACPAARRSRVLWRASHL
ncbi:uncharacterized protein LOC144152959 isoform X2 [Haemaphysalis longicornis]